MTSIGKSKTNKFHVTDMDKFKSFIKGLRGPFLKVCYDKTDPNAVQIFADDSMEWLGLPSMEPAFMEKIKGKSCYDDDGNEVPLKDIDNYDYLYDVNGDLIYDKESPSNAATFDDFLRLIQSVLPDKECFVYMEVAFEGYRDFTGVAIVATNKDIESCNIYDFVNKTAKKLIEKD